MSPTPSVKAVILVAGPQKGTRFRPLSLDLPKPLFPVAGLPVISHHIEALAAQVSGLREVLVMGFFPAAEMSDFVQEMTRLHGVPVRYLQEYTAMGTAGGIFHFRDRILAGADGTADAFFVLNGDVCADFPLEDLMQFHNSGPDGTLVTMMATEATRQQALNYGCVVSDKTDCGMMHYVEKPATYISSLINCGVYVFSKDIFGTLGDVYRAKQRQSPSRSASVAAAASGAGSDAGEDMWIERDILPALAGSGKGRVYTTTNWWSQIKTAGSAIYANRHYLQLYEKTHPDRLFRSKQPEIIGNVFVHPSAKVHPTAVLGPNVSIGENVIVGAGARVKESIILSNSTVGEHSLVLYTVIGMSTTVGEWARVEGTPQDPNPNKPFAKMDNVPLFNEEGKLNPSITILGDHVEVPSELVIRNAIVLPHKQIGHSFMNEIIL